MRIGKIYLFRTCYNNEVGHHHLHFGRGSKASRGVEKLSGGKKGKFQVCPNWRLLALKKATGGLTTRAVS